MKQFTKEDFCCPFILGFKFSGIYEGLESELAKYLPGVGWNVVFKYLIRLIHVIQCIVSAMVVFEKEKALEC